MPTYCQVLSKEDRYDTWPSCKLDILKSVHLHFKSVNKTTVHHGHILFLYCVCYMATLELNWRNNIANLVINGLYRWLCGWCDSAVVSLWMAHNDKYDSVPKRKRTLRNNVQDE